MKQIGLKITSLCFAMVLLFCTVTPVFAEEDKQKTTAGSAGNTLSINKEATVEVGKTVTFTLNISEAVKPIVGFELCLFYDQDHLQYQKGSLKFDNFDVVIYNEDLPGRIPMNHSALTNTKIFTQKSQFVSASFQVLKGGEADISYFVTELYSENFEQEPYLKSYKFTYDLTEGDNVLVKDGTPVVNEDNEAQANYQGDFVNYADGMGEDNSPKDAEEHVRVGTAVVTNVIEVTRAVGSDTAQSNGGGFFGSIWFILLIGLVVVGVIVTAVVIVSKQGKKTDE